MKIIETSAIINSIRSKVDKSLSFSAETPELTTQERSEFMELQGVNVSLVITPLDSVPTDKLKIDKDVNSKTPGQRLRAVLFLLWRQRQGTIEFEDYYKEQMEKFIDIVKGKLD